MNTLKLIIVWIFISQSVFAQKVTIGPEISIRSNLAYDILGRVGKNILLYSNRGNEREIMNYDDNLVLQSTRQLNLREKRALIYEVVNLDSLFGVFYGYRDKDDYIIAFDTFNSGAELKDSILVSRKERHWNGLEYLSKISEDESKIALYNIVDNDKFKLIVFDIAKGETVIDFEYQILNSRLYDDIEDMELTNKGEFFVLTQSNNSRSTRKSHRINIFKFFPYSDAVVDVAVPLRDFVCTRLKMRYDNINGALGVAGLYDEKRSKESTGLFWYHGSGIELQSTEIKLFPFEESLLFDIYGEDKKDRLEEFVVNDIFWRNDGSPILILEMQADYTRRATPVNYIGRGTYNDYASYSGWSDHYREDVIAVAIDINQKIDWRQVFYKKQFSQNDGAIFSSYFPFKTPSRLRLIFNDEIKNNSTVSQYIFDGTGNYKRASVLSTEYQNLRLRFAEGMQISSSEILVPSEKNYVLNLVKIDFRD